MGSHFLCGVVEVGVEPEGEEVAGVGEDGGTQGMTILR